MEEVLQIPDERIIWLAYAKITVVKGVVVSNPKEYRVCISGCRTGCDYDIVRNALQTIPLGSIVVHGGAKGVDSIADELAKDMGFEVEVWEADWKRYGKSAGPIRNREMIETCDMVIAFWDGSSRGTKNAISIANKNGLDVEVIPIEG